MLNLFQHLGFRRKPETSLLPFGKDMFRVMWKNRNLKTASCDLQLQNNSPINNKPIHWSPYFQIFRIHGITKVD